jgi:hypothetical protein
MRSISVEQVISALFAFLKTKRHPTGKKRTFNKPAYNKVLRLPKCMVRIIKLLTQPGNTSSQERRITLFRELSATGLYYRH